MPVPNPDFRPDHLRSISVFGDVSDTMVSQLAPEIFRLRSESEERPITVLINSDGGDPRAIDHIYSLLTTRGPGGKRPRLITVVVGKAASAAANMLTLGDYSIAYPKTDIHFHGIRYSTREETAITMELAEGMASQLQNKNRTMAALLARKGTERMAFHYARLRDECSELKKQTEGISDIECFANLLQNKVSSNGRLVIDKAIERWKNLRQLGNTVVNEARTQGKKGIEFEAYILHKVVDFEVNKNKDNDNWDLDAAGIIDVVQDYLLIREYDIGKHTELVQTIMGRFPHAFFEEEEITRIVEVAGKDINPNDPATKLAIDKVNEVIKPFCYFTTSIWRGLQEEENPLTPRDAYWLGALDEVYGTKLPCLRSIAEADPPEQTTIPLDSPAEQPPPT